MKRQRQRQRLMQWYQQIHRHIQRQTGKETEAATEKTHQHPPTGKVDDLAALALAAGVDAAAVQEIKSRKLS